MVFSSIETTIRALVTGKGLILERGSQAQGTKMLFDEPGLGVLSLPSEPEGLVGGVAWELFIRICEGEEIFGKAPCLTGFVLQVLPAVPVLEDLSRGLVDAAFTLSRGDNEDLIAPDFGGKEGGLFEEFSIDGDC